MSTGRKQFMGTRLRGLREERGITQAALARKMQISASYLNQIEQNQRPLTLNLTLRLNAALEIELGTAGDEAGLIRDIRAVLAEHGSDATLAELRDLSTNMPDVARTIILMQKRLRDAQDRADLLAERLDSPSGTTPMVYEEVREYFSAMNNHIPELDHAAEALAAELGPLGQALPERLLRLHGVTLQNSRTALRAFHLPAKVLALSAQLQPGQRLFQMATQIAFLELADVLDRLARDSGLSPEAGHLLRIGLANYFAGALILPYGAFLAAAEEVSYDIDLLSARFGLGFETICHRLSTLQREGARGVPFFFIRVDRAGNISKRQSATDFHFSRVGGTCPLWNVYDAFSRPGQILTQHAMMPDGRSYLWIARTVTSQRGGYGTPAKTFAIALGCDARNAERVVYAKGLDLRSPEAATPIGAGCKICERDACAQRAFPMAGRSLEVDLTRTRFEPYGTD